MAKNTIFNIIVDFLFSRSVDALTSVSLLLLDAIGPFRIQGDGHQVHIQRAARLQLLDSL